MSEKRGERSETRPSLARAERGRVVGPVLGQASYSIFLFKFAVLLSGVFAVGMLSGLHIRALRLSPRSTARLPILNHRLPSRDLFSTRAISLTRLYSTAFSNPRLTIQPRVKAAFDPRFFSSNGTLPIPATQLPVISPPAVGNWLLLSSALVIAVIAVGGVTRLTESGLSITEWRPITGVLPPLSQTEWESEFDKYKATPEFRLCVACFFFIPVSFPFTTRGSHGTLNTMGPP